MSSVAFGAPKIISTLLGACLRLHMNICQQPLRLSKAHDNGRKLRKSSYLGRSTYAWNVVHVPDSWTLIQYDKQRSIRLPTNTSSYITG